jgi:hypothetical protein
VKWPAHSDLSSPTTPGHFTLRPKPHRLCPGSTIILQPRKAPEVEVAMDLVEARLWNWSQLLLMSAVDPPCAALVRM